MIQFFTIVARGSFNSGCGHQDAGCDVEGNALNDAHICKTQLASAVSGCQAVEASILGQC
eukprot:m.194551 g.194551  ORF g.194551 m.194551 type:complete len:60 (-) comp53707_c0_seq14:1112-1291(-)